MLTEQISSFHVSLRLYVTVDTNVIYCTIRIQKLFLFVTKALNLFFYSPSSETRLVRDNKREH